MGTWCPAGLRALEVTYVRLSHMDARETNCRSRTTEGRRPALARTTTLCGPGEYRIVTGACYEHQPILEGVYRRAWFAGELLSSIQEADLACDAWVILPNHYHVLVQIENMKRFSYQLGQLHGRTSFTMNQEDGIRGRRVWYRCQDRCMRSEAHYYATMNYIHNNPVKHGYVRMWTDWSFSSVHGYLTCQGASGS